MNQSDGHIASGAGRFVQETADLLERLRWLSGAGVPLPEGYEDAFADSCEHVFGSNLFSDAMAAGMFTRDEGLRGDSAEVLLAIVDAVKSMGVPTWVFGLIWRSGEALSDVMDEVDGADKGHVESLEPEIAERLLLLEESAKIGAYLLLRFGDLGQEGRYAAYYLLVSEYGQAMDYLQPYAKVMYDEESFRLYARFLQRSREEAWSRQQEGGGARSRVIAGASRHVEWPDDPDPTSASRQERVSESPVPEPPTGKAPAAASDGGPFSRAALMYDFDARHVVEAYREAFRHGWPSAPDEGDPWRGESFSYGKLLSLIGERVIARHVAEALEDADGTGLEDYLALVEYYRDFVGEQGLMSLPLYAGEALLDTLQSGGEADEFDMVYALRDVCADMAAVLLSRIDDVDVAQSLALLLLEGNLDGYASMMKSYVE